MPTVREMRSAARHMRSKSRPEGAPPLVTALVLGAVLAHRQELRLRVDLRGRRRMLSIVRRTPLVE